MTQRPAAVVTGASSGIGCAFALALAARGHDLVVVGRGPDRLQAVADEAREAHGAGVEVLAADLGRDEGIAAVEARLRDRARPTALLVNAAGIFTRGPFDQMPVHAEVAEIQLDVVALVRLTHAALVPMVERGSGGVINVSSIAAYFAVPGTATYGACKAFVSSFTNAIHEELRGTGVRVMVLAPGNTPTDSGQRSVVDAALAAYERGRVVCIPGTINVAMAGAARALPLGLVRRMAAAARRRR